MNKRLDKWVIYATFTHRFTMSLSTSQFRMNKSHLFIFIFIFTEHTKIAPQIDPDPIVFSLPLNQTIYGRINGWIKANARQNFSQLKIHSCVELNNRMNRPAFDRKLDDTVWWRGGEWVLMLYHVGRCTGCVVTSNGIVVTILTKTYFFV